MKSLLRLSPGALMMTTAFFQRCRALARWPLSLPLFLSLNMALLGATEASNAPKPKTTSSDAVTTLILKRMEEQDKEFADFAEIEKALDEGQIEDFKAKLKAFKENYLLSAYQTFFPLLEAFCMYKLENPEIHPTVSLHFQLPPEVLSYKTYVAALKIKEFSEAGPLGRLLPGVTSPPEHTLHTNLAGQALQHFGTILQNYPKLDAILDIERRYQALERRIALNQLQNVLDLYASGDFIATVNEGFDMIFKLPHRLESLQVLLVIYKSYERLHLPDLMEPVRLIYETNRHKLLPLDEKHSLSGWWQIARSTDFALPSAEDEILYRFSKSLLLPIYRFEKNLEQSAAVRAQFEYFSEEEKEAQKLGKLKRLITQWGALHRRGRRLAPEELSDEVQKAFQEVEIQLEALATRFQTMSFKSLQTLDFEEEATRLTKAIRHLSELLEKAERTQEGQEG